MPQRKRKAPALAAAGKAKKTKMYNMPEKIKIGTILKDLMDTQWIIGKSIGIGGFGEIYEAAKKGEKKYEYVVKCEPHDNGPLFVEMHFYMRNGRLEDIKNYQKKCGLKSLGMPYMLGHGSEDINGIKHRFLVLPRYGEDLAKKLKKMGNRLPEGTCYRLAIQMLDVYEYLHSCGYIHGDLKPANILLGYGKQQQQAYLVDFGLATHYITENFKPDPKKMHDGTIEYTSRDAHLGVPTMRADLEILAYNLIEWLGAELPWVKENITDTPLKVQKSKESFMSNVKENLKKLFPKAVPMALTEYMEYVIKMKFNDKPDYKKCRNMFENALKTLNLPLTGDLVFKLNNINSTPTNAKVAKGISKINNKKEKATSKTKTDVELENKAINANIKVPFKKDKKALKKDQTSSKNIKETKKKQKSKTIKIAGRNSNIPLRRSKRNAMK